MLKGDCIVMRKTSFLITTAAAAVMASGAMAATTATVTIDQIDPMFQNVVGGTNVSTGLNGTTAEIRWGTPAGNGQSGYDFAPRAPLGFTLGPDTPTSLGTFTHLNRPIGLNTSIESVELDFVFGGAVIEVDGNPVGPIPASFGAVFDFEHDETNNTGNVAGCTDPLQQSDTPCDDIVTVSAQGGADEVITVGNLQFTFTLLGFGVDHGGGAIVFDDQFITEEGFDTSADLFFQYSVSVVPLPAAGWFLLGGLGAMGAVARRRKSKKAA